jgi:transcriptional regulator with XRE-family HTH domain
MRDRIRKDHKRKPHPVDVIAGRNLKLARSRAGFSQDRLGKAVGLTFQQIQKYERGANRMSLSRAAEFAAVLGISVSDFFDPPPAGSIHIGGSGYARWIALYQKALDAGIATEVCRITRAIISLRGGYGTRRA